MASRPKSPGSIVRFSINILYEFRKYLEIDLVQNNVSIINHLSKMNILLKYLNKPIEEISREDIRDFLSLANQKYSIQTYNCFIKTIRRFFRDFLNKPELVSSFKFKTVPFIPKINIISRDDLIRFYNAIEHPIVKMMFLMYTVTGLRRNDVIYLMLNELHIDKRMIVKNNNTKTKHRWVTFYNTELAELLHPYLAHRQDNSPRVFPVDKFKTFQKQWRLAQCKTGLHITPKDLRDWFTNEMLRLGVPESYIDAYLGHVPKSILSRHYIIYDPSKLQEVYDKANIKLFS